MRDWPRDQRCSGVLALATAAVFALQLFAVASARASFSQPFTATSFEEAQRDGRTILIEVFADWCPTCRLQQPVIEEIKSRYDFWNVVHLVIDFDTQKVDLKSFRVTQQATLLVFKGRSELGRMTGVTNGTVITRLLRQAL